MISIGVDLRIDEYDDEMAVDRISKPVGLWNVDDVSAWLVENDLIEYADRFSEHKIDGSVLLQLTETDLRLPPMQLTVLGDIKRIGIALEKLRTEEALGSSLSRASTPQFRHANADRFVMNRNDPRT